MDEDALRHDNLPGNRPSPETSTDALPRSPIGCSPSISLERPMITSQANEPMPDVIGEAANYVAHLAYPTEKSAIPCQLGFLIGLDLCHIPYNRGEQECQPVKHGRWWCRANGRSAYSG